MKNNSNLVSIIIPTLNSAHVLEYCLASIKTQTYKSYEILIIDGGSSDNTINIAKKYHCHIFNNPLKTAESAKAIGLKKAKGKYIALIDSDNILPNKNWLSTMLIPFSDPKIIGSEPLSFTYRKNAGFIERYSSLIGANDPYAYISGNYDRFSQLTQKWTNIKLPTENFKKYLKIKIDNNQYIPTIGANGTIFRKDFLLKFFKGDYFFDIDILAIAPKPLYFAKVKIGIIHTFCESSIIKFITKQNRRLCDYFNHIHERKYDYSNNFNKNIFNNLYLLIKNNLYFSLYSLLIIPSLVDSIRGFFRKPDPAWFFHPLACFITFWIYLYISILNVFGIKLRLNRNQWHQ